MPTFPDEVYEDFEERCLYAAVFQMDVNQRIAFDGDPTASVGAIIRCLDDGFMTVECGQGADDRAFVIVKRFDARGEQMQVPVVELDGTVMITI